MVNFYYVFIGVDIVLGVLVCCVSNSYIDCILCYVLRCFFFNWGIIVNSDIGCLMLWCYSGNGCIVCVVIICGVGVKGSVWILKGENYIIFCVVVFGWVNYLVVVVKCVFCGYWN